MHGGNSGPAQNPVSRRIRGPVLSNAGGTPAHRQPLKSVRAAHSCASTEPPTHRYWLYFGVHSSLGIAPKAAGIGDATPDTTPSEAARRDFAFSTASSRFLELIEDQAAISPTERKQPWQILAELNKQTPVHGDATLITFLPFVDAVHKPRLRLPPSQNFQVRAPL